MTVQPAALRAVLELVDETLRRHTGSGPLVLGIDGRSGSGKSELARSVGDALVEQLGDGDVVLFALEDAYRGWEGLAEGLAAVADGVLRPLAEGRPGAVRRYDWTTGNLGDVIHVPEPGRSLPRVLVLEGCGAGSEVCAPFVDALVWLDAPEPVRRSRALARDDHSWAPLWDIWAAQEERQLELRDARVAADLVIDTWS